MGARLNASRHRGAGRVPAGPPAVAAPARTWTAPLVALLCAGITVWTFSHARDYGFAQDDWTALARAKGLAPAAPPLWRWLSQGALWRLIAGPLAGSAAAAHALQVGSLAACSALLAALLTSHVGVLGALVAGAWFAAHFSLFHSGYWLSASGDTWAALFSLLAVVAVRRGGPVRWLAAPALVLAVGAKESAVALPIALAAATVCREAPLERLRALARDRLAWLLALTGAAWVIVVRAPAAGAALGGAAYAFSWKAVWPNLLTYGAWAANCWWPTLNDISDAVSPRQFGWGAGLLALGVASALLPATRKRGAAAAFLAFLALLLPVLALSSHTYHYYLTLPLTALAWWIAILVETALSRAPRLAAWATAVALALTVAGNGHAIVRHVELLPWRDQGQRSEAIMDRALIAERALTDLRVYGLPPGARLRFWSPQSRAIAARKGAEPGHESYDEHNFRAALAEGDAIRVELPNVSEVKFVGEFTPGGTDEYWAVYRPEGRLRVLRADTLAAVLAAGPPR